MQTFLPIKKDVELFRSGPIPGRYFYMSEFEDAVFKDYIKFHKGTRWPNTFFLFKDKRMVWINDFAELRQAGSEVFLRYMVKDPVRAELKTTWYKAVKKLSDAEKKIGDLFLEDLSDEQLLKLWQEFYDLVINFWLPTIPAELGNFGSGALLEEKLKKHIAEPAELSAVMEILTCPEEVSFSQQEEIDLAKSKNIEKHAQKYFWLRNSYNGVEESGVDFFAKRKKELSADMQKLIEERIAGVKTKKKKILKKYKLSKEIKNISKALCEGADWLDERKKHILIYIYYKELFLKEVARRFNYNIDLLRNCSTRENMQILEKRGVHTLIENRGNLFGFFMDPLKKEIVGEEAIFCWENYIIDNG